MDRRNSDSEGASDMNTSAIDVEIPIVEESGEQVLRIPGAFRLSGSRVHLHRESAGRPVTISSVREKPTPEEREQQWKELFAAIDASREAGEVLEIEREFCPPRDLSI
jgi:virulence-associated protein VagC